MNSARNDNNMSVYNPSVMVNQKNIINNSINPSHNPQLSNAYATKTARVESSLQQMSNQNV